MFSAIRSAYYSKKKIKKADEQEKALGPPSHAFAAVELSAKQGTLGSKPALVGDGSSLVTSIENLPGSFPSDVEGSNVGKRETFWSSQPEKKILSDAKLSKEIVAAKDTTPARPTQSWFPEVSTSKAYWEAGAPDVTKSSPVFAQLGNYGPSTENKAQKGTGERSIQRGLNPAPTKLFSPVSNTDLHEAYVSNTIISSSAPFQLSNQVPVINKAQTNSTPPWPVKPLPWFRGLFESNAPNPVISSTISTQTDIHDPMANKTRSGPIFAKPSFPWYPETSNICSNNHQINESNPFSSSQGSGEETTPSSLPPFKTAGPVILPAWLPHPTISNQNPPAGSSLKLPPVQSTAAPLFISSSFSFNLSQHVNTPSRASVTPHHHTDTTSANPIFNSPTMAPPLISPINSSCFPPRALFMPEPPSSMGQDKILGGSSGGTFPPKKTIPTLADREAESSRANYKQTTLHEHRPPRDIRHPYAENIKTETPRPPIEAILPPVEKHELSTSKRYQPSAKEIQSPGAENQRVNVKHWEQAGGLVSSEGLAITNADPHKASTGPTNKTNVMAARWLKMTEQEVCADIMKIIASKVSLIQYQSFLSIVAELYSQPNISLDLFEVKVYDIMKRILHWFSRELKLNVAMSNRFLPTGFHFTSFLYWEEKTLQIILSVSCIESISYVEVSILGDLGHGSDNLLQIGEYTLNERGPVSASTRQQTLMGESSILRTACGLFGACKNPECKTVLGKVMSQLGKVKYSEGSPPRSVEIGMFCENSILLQKAQAAKEEKINPKRLRRRKDPAWEAFVRRRREFENAILNGDDDDEGPTTAESAKCAPVEDSESPYSSSPDDKTKELLEKMKEQFTLSAATVRKIRKDLGAAKVTQHRCESSLEKMAGITKMSAEANNLDIPEEGSKLQDDSTATAATGRRRAATVVAEGVEFIMENPRWSEAVSGAEYNPVIEDAEDDEDDEDEHGDGDEVAAGAVQEEEQEAQNLPEPVQKQGANKGKNKSKKKKGKKGKNNWKRL